MIVGENNHLCTDDNNSIYCKYIPNTFTEVQNPTNKKHYVIWMISGCIGLDNKYLLARIRNFDDIGEAREYFKKVFENLNRPKDQYYVILLISKEGLSILEKYAKFLEDSGKILSKALKGEGDGKFC